MPDHLATYRGTWRQHHPGWEHMLWDEARIDKLRLTNRRLIDQAASLVPPWGVGQFVSDVARLEILYRHGGLYVDADFEALRPIDALIGDAQLCAPWEVQSQWLANGFMGCTAHHPFVGELIARLPGSVNRRRGQRPARMSGPKFLTRTWRALQPDMLTIDQQAVFPYGWEDLGTPKAEPPWPDTAWAVHHWQNQRMAQTAGETR